MAVERYRYCNWIKTEDLIGETSSVRQPLDKECKYLLLTWVTIQGNFRSITTNAAVKVQWNCSSLQWNHFW